MGFEQHALPDCVVSHEIIASWPFGRLIRPAGDGNHLVEIQLADYGQAAFRINFGFFPDQGVPTILGGTALIDNDMVHSLLKFYELKPASRFRWYFGMRYWPWQKPKKADYDKLIKDVILMLPQIDRTLKDGTIGPNVRTCETSLASIEKTRKSIVENTGRLPK
jgi:hypothetical protein